MASCNLRNFGPCFGQFREIQLFSRNLTDFVNYNKPCYNAITSVHCFYVKTKMLADFQICISVPLIAGNYKPKVVEKHFSEISKLSRAGARQVKPNRLMTEFCLQQHIILCYQIWETWLRNTYLSCTLIVILEIYFRKVLSVRFLREIEILKKYYLHHCILKIKRKINLMS